MVDRRSSSAACASAASYGCTLQELQGLMQLRGSEAVDIIKIKYGGVSGLCKRLKTSPETGLSNRELTNRREVFGANVLPPNPPKSLLRLAFEACEDMTLIVLLGAALFSIALALYSRFASGDDSHEDDAESKYGWIEGVAILVAVVVVVLVTAVNDWQKERQFRLLQNKIESDHKICVMRNGNLEEIVVSSITVGDICMVKYGDVIPADGVVIRSNDLKVDESSLTGEPDHVKKGDDVDPMLLSGTHVMEGSGHMVVTAVGPNSQAGIIFQLLGGTRSGEAPAPPPPLSLDEEIIHNEADGSQTRIKNKKNEGSHIDKLSGTGDHVENHQLDKMNQVGEVGGGDSTVKTHADGSQTAGKQHKPVRSKENESSVLQAKLTTLASTIGKFGLGVSFSTICILCIQFSVDTFYVNGEEWDTSRHVSAYVRFVIVGVTILVVAVPEGLPLAVTIALAYSVKKMLVDNNLVRHLDACETMGNATAICSDKTGTLTTNRMTAVQCYIGNKVLDKSEFHQLKELNQTFRTLIGYGISVNSSYTSREIPSDKPNELPQQLGNKTECALLGFVRMLGMDYNVIRDSCPPNHIIKVYTFNSERKSMCTVIEGLDPKRPGFTVFIKGASEIILQQCLFKLEQNGEARQLPPYEREELIANVIEPMASNGLRTIAIACKRYVEKGVELAINEIPLDRNHPPDLEDESSLKSGSTLIAILGIEDPVRDEVPDAICKCQKAGITVRMVTGDNVNTARSIATKCGILRAGDDYLVLEGKEFNRLVRDPKTHKVRQDLMDDVLFKLRVLARSTPEDKFILVEGLIKSRFSSKREVVAVTGDGTNDGPALKRADVGFAMGIAGTDVAKEASDIILTDDNFTSIVKAIMWGRNVYDSISKFLKFQLTVNLVAISVAVFGACVIKDSVLKAVQMLWVNLIMDTLASLALATETPTEELLQRAPYGRTKPIINRAMIKHIVGQSIYQISIIIILIWFGDVGFDVDNGRALNQSGIGAPNQHFTIIFNSFVMMTLFNEINARKIHGQRNVFSGLINNRLFIIIWTFTFGSQIVIIQFGGYAFNTAPLNLDHWLWCMVFGIGTLIWGQLIISIPDRYIPKRRKRATKTRISSQVPQHAVQSAEAVGFMDSERNTTNLADDNQGQGVGLATKATNMIARATNPLKGAYNNEEDEDSEEDEDIDAEYLSNADASNTGQFLWFKGLSRLKTQTDAAQSLPRLQYTPSARFNSKPDRL